MTDRIIPAADDLYCLLEFCEHTFRRPLTPEEIEQLAEDVIDMHEAPRRT